MKRILLCLLLCYRTLLQAQNPSPVSMEDKILDAYLSNRKPAALVIRIRNLPNSDKKVTLKCTLVQLGLGGVK